MQKSIYQTPEVESVEVAIEVGFTISDFSQQEPSPWEDM